MCNNYTCYNCGQVVDDFETYYDHVSNKCDESRSILQLLTEVSKEENINVSTEPLGLQFDKFALQSESPKEQLETATETRRVAFELFLTAGNEVKKAIDTYVVFKQNREESTPRLYQDYGWDTTQMSIASVEEQLMLSEYPCLTQAEVLDVMECEMRALLAARTAIVDYKRAGEYAFAAIRNEISTVLTVMDSIEKSNEDFYRAFKIQTLQNLIWNLNFLNLKNGDQFYYLTDISLNQLEKLLANEIEKCKNQGM